LSYCIIYVSSYFLKSLKKQMKEKKKYIDSNKHPYVGHGYGLSSIRFLPRVTRRMMLILPGNFSPPLFVCAIHVAQSFAFCIVYCGSLFVFLAFLFWPLYCLSFGFLLLITRLVSSNLFCNHISAILKSVLLIEKTGVPRDERLWLWCLNPLSTIV